MKFTIKSKGNTKVVDEKEMKRAHTFRDLNDIEDPDEGNHKESILLVHSNRSSQCLDLKTSVLLHSESTVVPDDIMILVVLEVR